jgi:hypothetical protein
MGAKRGEIPFPWLLLFILGLVAVGCASVPDYSRTLNGWIGLNADDLVSTWGEPSSVVSNSDGNVVYAYEVSGSRKLPDWGKYVGNTYHVFPGPTIMEACNTYFQIDQGGLIVEAFCEGNACP